MIAARLRIPLLLVAVAVTGCVPRPCANPTPCPAPAPPATPVIAPAPPPAPVAPPAILPPLIVEQPPDSLPLVLRGGRYDIEDPLARLPLGEPVTLSATSVDVPALLVALGESLGISLVVDPEVEGRITVNFQDVPAREALRVVLAQAGLFVAAGPPPVPWAPVVFYALPTDIETASVETIQARFNVSRAMAEFIVRSRVRP